MTYKNKKLNKIIDDRKNKYFSIILDLMSRLENVEIIDQEFNCLVTCYGNSRSSLIGESINVFKDIVINKIMQASNVSNKELIGKKIFLKTHVVSGGLPERINNMQGEELKYKKYELEIILDVCSSIGGFYSLISSDLGRNIKNFRRKVIAINMLKKYDRILAVDRNLKEDELFKKYMNSEVLQLVLETLKIKTAWEGYEEYDLDDDSFPIWRVIAQFDKEDCFVKGLPVATFDDEELYDTEERKDATRYIFELCIKLAEILTYKLFADALMKQVRSQIIYKN